MAIAYAAIANGGTVVTPARRAAGRRRGRPGRAGIRSQAAPPRQDRPGLPRRHPRRAARRRAGPGGTSYAVFGGFPIPVAGKTGTAQRPPYADQSWYVVLAPYPDPQYRHRRDDRGRRLRRRHRGARRAARSWKRTSSKQLTEGSGSPKAKEAKEADVRDPRPPRPSRAVHGPARHRRAARPALHGRLARRLARDRTSPRFSVFTLEPGDRTGRARQPRLLRRPPGDLRRSRPGRDVPAVPDRLLALPRAAGRHLHLPLRRASRSSSSSASPPAARGAPSTFPSSPSSHRSSASSCSCLRLPGSSSMAPGGARRGSAPCATSASASPRLRSFSCSRTSAPHWCSGRSPSP